MWETVELRELRVFLTLAEELHFGSTAERLGLTQSRVSQSLRALEHKLGVQLVHRTSRRVALTPAGERFRSEAGAACDRLATVLQDTHDAHRRLEGTLRLGLLSPASGGPHLLAIIAAFEARFPDCDVQFTEVSFAEQLEPLRRGEIDALATRLPLEQPDLVVGVILSREPRVLAVARDHPLAERENVSIEDVADYLVGPFAGFPKETMDALVPPRTPSGRPIRRLRPPPRTLGEFIFNIARGRTVHPTVPSVEKYFGHPDIVYVPIRDMPVSKTGLAWRRRAADPRLREFVRVARETLQVGAASPGRPGRAATAGREPATTPVA